MDGFKKLPEFNQTEQFDPGYADSGIAGAGLPPVGSYGQPQAPFNERIAELAIGTHITIGGKDITDIDELPVLFYFLTDNWRHFQLSNINSKIQRRLEVKLKHIHRMADQDGMDRICQLKQIELLNSIYFNKSRSDLNRQTEREIWTLQTSAMRSEEAKRPTTTGGGFISSLFGMGNRGGGHE